ncbi:MAG: helix-turn-helix transcriptional regulator, partial [Paludibacteraceae bacterium]|nr:helix-turn-helix transcriptional regulator [Paludibacteraceae bacterium]
MRADFHIGERVRELRKQRGFSMYKLSLTSGISIGHLQRIESGKTSPQISTLEKLLGALDATITIEIL